MPNVDFVPFKPWHLKLFKPGKLYDRPNLDPETIAYIYRKVEGLTILLDGEIAAIIGVLLLHNGVGEITMIPSDTFYKYRKTCLRLCKEFVDLTAETFHLHRLQATALVTMPHHGRFLEKIGLVRETNDTGLRGYGPNGEDMHMYAYVRVK
jgi:hypothetical protein